MEGLPNIDNSNLERNSYLQFILGVNFDRMYLTIIYSSSILVLGLRPGQKFKEMKIPP